MLRELWRHHTRLLPGDRVCTLPEMYRHLRQASRAYRLKHAAEALKHWAANMTDARAATAQASASQAGTSHAGVSHAGVFGSHPWQFRLVHLLWLVLGVALVLSLTLELRLWGAALALLAASCVLLVHKRLTAELAIALLLGLVALYLLYAPSGRIEAMLGRSSACHDQLRRIALALAQYRAEHGRLPPPHTQDATGRPLHSWRALILPYLAGTGKVSGRYRYDEPWDGPNNRRLHGEECCVFRCPADDVVDATATSYLAVTGPGSPWHGSSAWGDIAKDEECLLIVEVSGSAIHWYEPRDLAAESLRLAQETPQAGEHALAARHCVGGKPGAFVVFASGEVRFIESGVHPQRLLRWLER